MDREELEISDDEDNNGLDHNLSTSGQKEQCITCGSMRFYRDSSDSLICSDCYTQSQTLSQRETVDIDDVFTNNKRSKLRRYKIGRSSGVKDEDLDQSQPLPSLETCLYACQLLIKIMADKAIALSCIQSKVSEPQKEKFIGIVGDIWFRYLKAWQIGVEHFSNIFPEQRFSIRDYFLDNHLRGMIVRHLSARSMKTYQTETIQKLRGSIRVRKRGKEDDTPTTRQPKKVKFQQDTMDILPMSQKDSTDPEHLPHRIPTKIAKVIYFRPCCRKLSDLKDTIPIKQGETLSKEHAILHLEPSCSVLASIVYLGLIQMRLGVSSAHFRAWLSNGSIPYANAAFTKLPKPVQDSLKLIQTFFTRNLVPPASLLDQNADLLMIACEIILPRSKVANPVVCSQDFAHAQMYDFPPVGKSSKVSTFIKNVGKVGETETGNAFVDNIPLMTMRFIADLGLPQVVLDYSLSLMGLFTPEAKSKIRWLPPSLNVSSPGRIVSPSHILAVIVAACKMCEGWERWSIFPRKKVQDNLQSNNGEGRNSMTSLGQRFIPSSESHLDLVNNGDTLEQYLDYIEESVLPSKIPQYDNLFTSWGNIFTENKTDLPFSLPQVQPCAAISGIPKQRKMNQEVNGIGKYIIYDDFRSTTFTKVKNGNSKPRQTCRPFHSHYGLLIEYISYVFDTEPSELHFLVACIDEELLKLGRKGKR